ncbi:MAG: lipoyl(octanoyl) transferase LipB [Alphaproteobacteria bacterium]|nr:lipoyl(octanoyl) transferase LipB [Alphaproteobacteria bacterium]
MITATDTPSPDRPAEWRVEPGTVFYPDAMQAMESRVDAVIEHRAPELIWLLQHPPLYTAGTSADAADLKDPARFPVYETGRGGQYTYHGPGQRVIYAVTDLRERGRDLRAHVWRLEEWVIRVLADFGIHGERRDGRIGIWVARDGREEKIAAIGVRVRKWVAYHGLALNVDPDLAHFTGIVPCGLAQFGVTSLRKLGVTATMADVDAAFLRHKSVILTQD